MASSSTVKHGDGQMQSYGFDPMGNRLTKSDSLTSGGTTTTTTTASTIDTANRLLSVGQKGTAASAVTSDADGNTLTDTSGRTITWGSQNRMACCLCPSGKGLVPIRLWSTIRGM